MARIIQKSLIFGPIALIAISVGIVGWIGIQRRDRYRLLAEYHLGEMAAFDGMGKSDRELADSVEGQGPRNPISQFLNPVENTAPIRASELLNLKRAAYHSALYLKYKEASDQPWMAINPDPPSPSDLD